VTRAGIAVLAVFACGNPKPQRPPPAPAVSQCSRVADHVVGLMSGAQKAPPEATDPFRRVVEERCSTDKWSGEAQSCLLELTALEQGDRCQQMMTKEQVEAFHRDSEAALADLHSQLHEAPRSDAASD